MTNIELSADMHCRSCEQRVARAVSALDGVHAVETDLKRQRVAVQFDDQVLTESDLRTAVEDAASHGVLDG